MVQNGGQGLILVNVILREVVNVGRAGLPLNVGGACPMARC